MFDLLHIGHIHHLEQARKFGPVIVLLAADEYVHKGPNSPVYPEMERAEMLASISTVNYVSVVGGGDVLSFLESYGPVVYVKGEDYADRENQTIARIREAVERRDGYVAYTEGKPYSSTRINNEYYSQSEWRDDFSTRYLYDDIQLYLDRCVGLVPYVVGEPIQDVYIQCVPLGKSAKDSIVLHELIGATGKFHGGADIVAEHVREMTGSAITHGSLPKIRKQRYLEANTRNKLFGIDTRTTYTNYHRTKILNDLERISHDMVIVADFGHGLIDGSMADKLCDFHPVCATVQSNGMNWGFNLASKYTGIHYLVLDEVEARLSVCDNDSPVDVIAHKVMDATWPTYLAITLGRDGVDVYRRGPQENIASCHVPAFATKVIDNIGAGDAFLSWTSPLVAINAPLDVIGFIGNIAAGIHVGVVGNSEPVSRAKVNKWVGGLLG